MIGKCEQPFPPEMIVRSSFAHSFRHMNNKTELVEAIRQLPYIAGETNTSGALTVMQYRVFNTSSGDREGAPNVGVIITDGRATNISAVGPAIAHAHESGTWTCAIGITKAIDEPALKQLASDPKQASFDQSSDSFSFFLSKTRYSIVRRRK